MGCMQGLILYALCSVYGTHWKWLSDGLLGVLYHSADHFSGVSSAVPVRGEMVGSATNLQIANLEMDSAHDKTEVLIVFSCSFSSFSLGT